MRWSDFYDCHAQQLSLNILNHSNDIMSKTICVCHSHGIKPPWKYIMYYSKQKVLSMIKLSYLWSNKYPQGIIISLSIFRGVNTSLVPNRILEVICGTTIQCLQRLRIEGKKLAFKPNENSSITHHAKGNSMTSPTQTVVGKGKPNPLIA